MRLAYFDCFSGASGDMILGSMLDAGLSLESLRAELSRLGVEGYRIEAERVTRCGLGGTRARVTTLHSQPDSSSPHAHRARRLPDVLRVIEASSLSNDIKARATAVFRRLAEAEGRVHSIAPEEVHFHEVGALDAIVDIVGAAIGLKLLQVDRVMFSTLRLGNGYVDCAHGRLPVPAPATMELTRGFVCERTEVQCELLTPTGAAILTTLGEQGPHPAMTMERIGYGAGSRDNAELPNLLRLCVGEIALPGEADEAWVLETNLDDIAPQTIGYVFERLLEAGALDVFATPIQMKKSRPGVKLSVIADEATAAKMEELLFRETTTFGIRRYRVRRAKLSRRILEVNTPYGHVRVKVGSRSGEVLTISPEYEDCRAIAEERGIPLMRVMESARTAAEQVMKRE